MNLLNKIRKNNRPASENNKNKLNNFIFTGICVFILVRVLTSVISWLLFIFTINYILTRIVR